MMKTYTINQDFVDILGFEEAAFYGWLREHGKIADTGYSPIIKENPFWKPGKVKKMLEKLEDCGAITKKEGKNASRFIIELHDKAEKKEKAEIVDSRESKTYIAIMPIDGQGPTEVEMSGGQIVASIINHISQINPDAKRFYSWRVERGAILDMLDAGYDPTVMIHYADLLKHTHGKMYAPVITSPREFALKFSKLAAFIVKEKEKQGQKNNKYAI